MREMADLGVVFVVHGRNSNIRSALFGLLRAVGLRPLEWAQAVAATGKPIPMIADILDSAFARAQAVIVLMTGDDEVRLSEPLWGEADTLEEQNTSLQPRPNVLFEAGLAVGRYPDRTIFVEVGSVKAFSDIAGYHTVRLDNSLASRHDLVTRLQLVGCQLDLSGTDWHSCGDFARLPRLPTPEERIVAHAQSSQFSASLHSAIPGLVSVQNFRWALSEDADSVNVTFSVGNLTDKMRTHGARYINFDVHGNIIGTGQGLLGYIRAREAEEFSHTYILWAGCRHLMILVERW